jgi:hypothetical protein
MSYENSTLVDLIGYTIEQLNKEIDAEEVEKIDYDTYQKSIYIGTVMNLVPSGKFYTPWACSNVTEEEAVRDEEWWERLNDLLAEHNMFTFSGEGDPCDIYIGKSCEDSKGTST